MLLDGWIAGLALAGIRVLLSDCMLMSNVPQADVGDVVTVPPDGVPLSARQVKELTIDGASVWTEADQLYIALRQHPDQAGVHMPRLANSLRSVRWLPQERQLNVRPEPDEWWIDPGQVPAADEQLVIRMDLDGPLTLMSESLRCVPDERGVIELPASHAVTKGKNVRFEPQAHKNTVGYWSDEQDTVEWHFQVTIPGRYEVDVLQGCGRGHGGSEVRIQVAGQSLSLQVEDTGHFQNFIWKQIGAVELAETSLQTLQIIPVRKKAGAVMDVRRVRLVPVGTERSFEPELTDPRLRNEAQQ